VAGVVSSVRLHQSKKGEPMAFVEIEDTQATREIVVFPRAFAAHKELLAEGRLILVRGKVDAQEGRAPKILADHITTELTSYRASDEASHANASQNNGSNGHEAGARDNIKPAILAETLVPYQSGAAGPPPPPEEPPQVDTTPPARWLHITIPRTNNLVHDKARLKEVYKLLVENPGQDQFSFYIPDGHRKIRIDFPNQTTHDTAHLRQRLTQVLGTSAVRVE
jgi:hypothetical protein